MSRTIRRKNGYDRGTHWGYRTGLWDQVEMVSKYGGIYRVDIALQGRLKRQRIARYHSDSYVSGRYANIYPHSSRQIQHQIQRARVRNQIVRYIKDNEHEVVVCKYTHYHYWY